MSSWSHQEIAEVRKLWLDGQSATQIAARYRGRTRSAICGLAHRNGWSLQGRKAVPVTPEPAARRTQAAEKVKAAGPSPAQRASRLDSTVARHLAKLRAQAASAAAEPAPAPPEPPSVAAVTHKTPCASSNRTGDTQRGLPAQSAAVRLRMIHEAAARAGVLLTRPPALVAEPAPPARVPIAGARPCAWLSDDAEPNCRQPAREGGRYCEAHHARVYQVGTAISPGRVNRMGLDAGTRRAAPQNDELRELDGGLA